MQSSNAQLNRLSRIFSILLSLLPLLSVNAQIKVYSNNKVRIGDPNSPAPLHTHLEIDQETRFKCYTATGVGGTGLIFGNYHNLYPSGGPYDDPILKPWFTNSMWIGNSNFKIWQIYSFEQWVNFAEIVTSDSRYKQNIRSLPYGLSDLLKLEPKLYDLAPDTSNSPAERAEIIIEKGKNQIGLIAQDVKEIIPEIVQYNSGGEYYGISYTSLIPILVKAIQEQQIRIELLESKLETSE